MKLPFSSLFFFFNVKKESLVAHFPLEQTIHLRDSETISFHVRTWRTACDALDLGRD
jgi:hypothetical protein